MPTTQGANTGHYNHHFNLVLGIGQDGDGGYLMAVPGTDPQQEEHQCLSRPCLPVHELLFDEVCNTPGLQEDFARSLEGGSWTSQYHSHPVVQAAQPGETVWPVALFCDKVPFQNRDSLLVFYVHNMISGRRHLCCSLRTSEMCHCGCSGWCSVCPVMHWLKWSLQALARGFWPDTRHDGSPFDTGTDSARSAMAGKPLMKAALIFILGDWAEVSHTWGFPDWSSVLNPCFAALLSRMTCPWWGPVSCIGTLAGQDLA